MHPLVIFDCDGVLVDTEARSNAYLADYLSALGYPISAEACRTRFQGGAMSRVCDAVRTETGIKTSVDQLRSAVYAGLETGVKAIPNVEDLVQTLIENDYPVCVASSGTHAKMRMTLGQTNLLDLVGNVLFSASEVARGKPFPDVFEYAMSRMGHGPDTTIVIEDSVAGVTAGHAAGARVLGYCGDDFTDPSALAAAGAEPFFDMNEAFALIAGQAG